MAEDLAATSDTALDLPGVVAELERRAEAQHVPSAQGVTVSTLHSAKGLEWDAVALFGIQEGSLPFVLATRPEEVAEERRLLYVGLTRAREHLHVSWSRSRGGGQATRKPSRFLDPLLPAAIARGRGRPGAAVAEEGHRAVGPLSQLRARAERRGRAQDRPAQRLPGDVRRAHADAAQGVAQAAGHATRRCPAFCVFTDATLVAIAESRPTDQQSLIKIPGLGQSKLTKYGEQVLAILAAPPATTA